MKTGRSGDAGWHWRDWWPGHGLHNPCLAAELPPALAEHPLVVSAREGVDSRKLWDCHVHLIGTGEGGSGIWLNPQLGSPWHPMRTLQRRFFLNASCVREGPGADGDFIRRLLALRPGLGEGSRLMLLAFDYHYDAGGRRREALSSFHVPNTYAAAIAAQHPDAFEWIASVHPYREDALEALEWAAAQGARAVKWLPPAMGMDPSAKRCDAYYDTLIRLNLPLLTHGGDEQAVHRGASAALGNPLLLRRPLERGVRVIVAHCASLGVSHDLDRGLKGGRETSFRLFARLMDEASYEGRLFGDISAVPQVNRAPQALIPLLQREDWHGRLLHGSDYPLPGVVPLFSLPQLCRLGLLDAAMVPVLAQLRCHNPLLFDFVLKRSLRWRGRGFAASVFETAGDFFTNKGAG